MADNHKQSEIGNMNDLYNPEEEEISASNHKKVNTAFNELD